MSPRTILTLAAALGALAVIVGAFGAHALRTRLEPELLAVWRTGVEYQFYHVFALLVVGLFAAQRPSTLLSVAACLFIAGIVVFSGSLYALALSGIRVLGAVTPFGGLAMIAGWICLAFAAWRQ
ncbi:MAG: DUF423 domain-containing protein [Gammaproteobacteria bacterium]|jgi:uncharacterized membrane protein YgdD (TMEM256/DUF423 family)|nr:DUF423 domain-containing protein [Gammaproteobacteria bacterium]